MEYPEDFPNDLRELVEGAIAQAEIDLIEQRKSLGLRFESQWQGVLLLWVKTIFFEFSERACDMGRRGTWSVEKIRIEASIYLKKLATQARARHAPMSSSAVPYIASQEIKKIIEAITHFDEWAEFQKKLKRIVKESANQRLAPLVTETDMASLKYLGEPLTPFAIPPPSPVSDTAAPLVSQPLLTSALETSKADEIYRRAILLMEYKSATSVSEYFIYTHAKSGIHKPQFRAWKKGDLAADSATVENFERFLAEKAVPPPKREKRKK